VSNQNDIERTHTELTFEFGAGLGIRGGASISLNRDNQTREISITGCLDVGRTAGDVRGVVGYNENADGGVTDSWKGSVQSKSELFVGLGPAIKASYDLNSTNLEITKSEPNKSVYNGFGVGVFVGGEGCLEVNPKALLHELGEAIDKLLDNLVGSGKESIFDRDDNATNEKLNSNSGGNSHLDAKDSSHEGRDTGLGMLADGRSLGERPEREHFRF